MRIVGAIGGHFDAFVALAHAGARSRRFYERLGFEAAEVVEDGPEGWLPPSVPSRAPRAP